MFNQYILKEKGQRVRNAVIFTDVQQWGSFWITNYCWLGLHDCVGIVGFPILMVCTWNGLRWFELFVFGVDEIERTGRDLNVDKTAAFEWWWLEGNKDGSFDACVKGKPLFELQTKTIPHLPCYFITIINSTAAWFSATLTTGCTQFFQASIITFYAPLANKHVTTEARRDYEVSSVCDFF